MWLNTVDSLCTKMRKILAQAVLCFGYSDLEEELSGAPASRVGLRLYTCALTTELYLSLTPALFPPWHPKQRSAMVFLNTACFPC